MNIDAFGKSLLIDRSSSLVLLVTRSNEISKYIMSSILDTYTIQFSDGYLSQFDVDVSDENSWVNMFQGKFYKFEKDVPQESIEKRRLSKLYRRGYYLILEQANFMGSVYDNLSDISSYDLPLYMLNKEKYIEKFAEFRNMTKEMAERHLEFLSDSLISAHFRKQTLIWKYSNLLKNVKTEEDYEGWRKEILRETITLGKV